MAKRLDPRTIDIPKDVLERLYIDEGLTINQIAEKLGHSVVPIWKSLRRHGIRLKSVNRHSRACEKAGITAKILRHLYLKRQFTIGKIAERLQVNRHTIQGALKHFDIPIRSQAEVNQLSAQKRVWAANGHGRNWRGGTTTGSRGYKLIYRPDHPRANKAGYVFEHILVWEKTHGKPVPKGWIVHHLNGIKSDNRPENLVAMPKGAHSSLAKPYIERIQQLERELAELQQLKLTIG